MPDPMDVTEFRFRSSNAHNRDMLEYQSEKAFKAGAFELSAAFAQAAAQYTVAEAINGKELGIED